MYLPVFAESLQRCGSEGTIWSHGSWNLSWMPIFGTSAHPGVVNVVLGDASTKSLSKNIDPTVWWQLIRVADGEIVGEF